MTNAERKDGGEPPVSHRSETLQLLRKAPRTRDELPDAGSAVYHGGLRRLTVRIKVPDQGSSGTIKSRGRTVAVYCLYGDERRGIRRFIDENEHYVESCLGDKSNPLANNWDDVLYQLLREEWEFRQYGRGGDDE